MKSFAFASVLIVASFATLAVADSWVAPKSSGVASPNGELLVRVVPGNSMGEAQGFGETPKGEHAHALYYRLEGKEKFALFQEVTLENPIAPFSYVVTNQGSLVTFDNWANVGYGKAIVIYTPTGIVRKSYTLQDLYNSSELEKVPKSVSSHWWRCSRAPVLDGYSNNVVFNDVLGNIIEVNPESGTVNRVGKHKGCENAT
jgi:hypothetical protein